MIKRRRIAVLAVFAVVASVFLLPASPAKAATFDNACVNSLIPTQSSLIPITMTATTSPNPVAPGGTVTLSNIQQHADIPPAVFIAGYNAGVLTTGVKQHPGHQHPHGDRGDEHGRGHPDHQQPEPARPRRRSPIPTGSRGPAMRRATPGALDVTYANQTWTAGASGAINFREDTVLTAPHHRCPPIPAGINITAVVAGDHHGPVRLRPRHGGPRRADPSTIVLTDPAATFASTLIATPAPTVTSLNPTHGAGAAGGNIGDDHRHRVHRRDSGPLRRQRGDRRSTVVNATTITANAPAWHPGDHGRRHGDHAGGHQPDGRHRQRLHL